MHLRYVLAVNEQDQRHVVWNRGSSLRYVFKTEVMLKVQNTGQNLWSCVSLGVNRGWKRTS
jgi:hypothetical protein